MAYVKTCTTCMEEKPIAEFGKHKLCRDGINPVCKECNRAKAKAWQALNPEKAKASSKAYRLANHEKVKASKAEYYAANSEEVKASVVAWRNANPEKVKSYGAKWIEKNKDKVSANGAAWRAANPDRARAHVHNYRAQKRAVGGVLSKGLTAKLFALQQGKCPCCGQPLGDDYHLDHIVPVAMGGPNIDENIQLLRQRCNNQKHSKHPVDFMQQRGFLL